MRLTPSWFRSSSSAPSEERSSDAETDSTMTIYRASELNFSERTVDVDARAEEFIPGSNADLVSVLDEMNTPVTVDEIVDELIEPAQPSIDTWAAVHERLSEDRLPALDASGDIEFDDTTGIVERSTSRSIGDRLLLTVVLSTLSIALLFVLFVFL